MSSLVIKAWCASGRGSALDVTWIFLEGPQASPKHKVLPLLLGGSLGALSRILRLVASVFPHGLPLGLSRDKNRRPRLLLG